ncbi:MAG: hypothetical protein JXA57_16380 [Armatimonadetes bacterium]|nr:hypothetical protein [Armatimonadota bacterium]
MQNRGLARLTTCSVFLVAPLIMAGADEASTLRDVLLAQSEQLHSLRCTYSFLQENVEDGRTVYDEAIEYRFSGQNRYYRSVAKAWSHSRGRYIDREDVRARLGGVISSFHTDEFVGPENAPSGIIGMDGWVDARGFSILEMLGAPNERPLEQGNYGTGNERK